MVHHPVAEANESSPFGSLAADDFYSRHSVIHGSEFITNPRGIKIFTHWWIPLPPANIIGTVALIHGYTGESNWFMQLTAILLAKSGFATCAIDHQGHGFSEGLQNHIPDINPVVDDCVSFFNSFREIHVPPHLPSFLYSESLGGAIALLICLRQRDGKLIGRKYDGMILNGAMCGISDKFKPPWPLEHFLSAVAWLVPTWQVVPTRGSIPDVSFKVEWKRKLAKASPRRSMAKPRAATALELLRVCREVQSRFDEIDIPFLIIHGEGDVVCDPACAEELFQRAASADKTIKIYPEMWHQLVGESDENVDLVFGDVVDWLKTRAEKAGSGGA